MKDFLGGDFLLGTESASELFSAHAEKMPVVDYHCHIDPKDIAEDKRYDSITELWLGGDHYKWRAMRCNGVPEREITGALHSDPFLVFQRWAETLGRAIGNPLYHWSYLELRRYFGIHDILSPENVREIYDRCNARLRDADMSARGIIKRSNVKVICTTDDPTSDLRWHKVIAEDAKDFGAKVLPAFRPDKVLNIDQPGFSAYIGALSNAADMEIKSFAELKAALRARVDYFHTLGCRASDHAVDAPLYAEADEAELDAIFRRGITGESVGQSEADRHKTALLLFLAGLYNERGWVMQIHFGCIRNNSQKSFALLGPDTGFDCVGNSRGARELVSLLNAMEERGALPKMVLYSLNPYDNEIILSAAVSFERDAGVPARIQLGSAWWFNDHKIGMEKQLTDFANLGVLGNFIGMLTDSRSFLSYTRHEYFRRILCNLIGGWMENGELPADMDGIGALVEDICYNNAVRFFGFDV